MTTAYTTTKIAMWLPVIPLLLAIIFRHATCLFIERPNTCEDSEFITCNDAACTRFPHLCKIKCNVCPPKRKPFLNDTELCMQLSDSTHTIKHATLFDVRTYGRGATALDIDGDFDDDIIFSSFFPSHSDSPDGQALHVYRNNGDGNFTSVPLRDIGLDPMRAALTLTAPLGSCPST